MSVYSSRADIEEVREIAEHYFGITETEIQKLDGYDDLNFHLIPPILVNNSCSWSQIWRYGYVMKIFSSKHLVNRTFIDEYINVLLHLNKERVLCPCPVINKFGAFCAEWISKKLNHENSIQKHEKIESESQKRIILLLTYLPGKLLRDVKCDERFYFSLGRFIFKLHVKLQPFCKSVVLHRDDYLWSLKSVNKIIPRIAEVIPEMEKQLLVSQILLKFDKFVIANINSFQEGIIHSDINESNIIIRLRDGEPVIGGLIDFTDMVHASYLFEISIAATYIGLNNPDNYMSLIASLLLGYGDTFINHSELSFLKICICARLCQSLVLGLCAFKENPSNEYVLFTQKSGWFLLNELSRISDDQFLNTLQSKLIENKKLIKK